MYAENLVTISLFGLVIILFLILIVGLIYSIVNLYTSIQGLHKDLKLHMLLKTYKSKLSLCTHPEDTKQLNEWFLLNNPYKETYEETIHRLLSTK